MKKILSFGLLIVLTIGILAGCGTKDAANTSSMTSEQQGGTSAKPAKAQDTGSTKGKRFDSLKDFCDAVTEIESKHEAIINEYDGMPVIEVPAAFMPIVTAPIFEMLNLDNKDGRFEGDNPISGVKQFIEKKGPNITFGNDYIRHKDGFSPNDKKGDRVVANGSFDGNKGIFKLEEYSQRDGVYISKTNIWCRLTDDDTVLLFYQFGNNTDIRGDEKISDTAIFLTTGKNHYDFVIARNTSGPNYAVLPCEADTVEEAQKLFTEKGYEIDRTGGIKNGKYEVNILKLN